MEELIRLFIWNELLDERSHVFWAQISDSQLGTPQQINQSSEGKCSLLQNIHQE